MMSRLLRPPRGRALSVSRSWTRRVWVLLAVLPATQVVWAVPNTINASPATDMAVTVYRGANESDQLDLDDPNGFALVTETRTVSIPAGESRIRFEGVADAIDPATAILTGLPTGLVEMNHDAQVLSPSALVAATVGRKVTWVRTSRKTGQVTQIPGTLLSDASGLVFKSATGEIEALRCSGLTETLAFEPTSDTNATPTLSALVRTPKPIQVKVRLSYLALGFDWLAHYSAVVAEDGKTMSLGAWVTLANANTVTFADAQAKVVAGKVNHETGTVEPINFGAPILAECWPQGSTSDALEPPRIDRAEPLWDGPGYLRAMSMRQAEMLRKAEMGPAVPAPMADMSLQEIVTAARSARARLVKEEQLGDLKLYRVPDRTSVVSRQMKQVRLMDRDDIPVELVYHTLLTADSDQDDQTLTKLLRTKNNSANGLGLALPSGHVSLFAIRGSIPLLLQETPFKDTAVNEDLEFEVGDSPDVHVTASTSEPEDEAEDNPKSPPAAGKHPQLPRVPGVKHPASLRLHSESRIEISNARPESIRVEIGLELSDGVQLVRADSLPTLKDGVPTFSVTVPANGRYTIRYRTGEPPT